MSGGLLLLPLTRMIFKDSSHQCLAMDHFKIRLKNLIIVKWDPYILWYSEAENRNG